MLKIHSHTVQEACLFKKNMPLPPLKGQEELELYMHSAKFTTTDCQGEYQEHVHVIYIYIYN